MHRSVLPVLLIIIGTITFLSGLDGEFIYDDGSAIVENEGLDRLWPPSTPPQTTIAGRPVIALTLAINHAIGGLDPRGYHVFNLAVHVAAGLVLFGLVRRTLRRPPLADRFGRAADWLGFATALLWLVHPLQTECLYYVVQRTESLMGLFYLLTVYAAVRANDDRRWSIVAIAACAVGMGCKEVMVTAPLAVVLYDLALRDGPVGRVIARRWPLYAGLALTWIVLAILNAGGPRSWSVGFGTEVTAFTYALNQCVAIVRYLRQTVWPYPLAIDYGSPEPLTVMQALPSGLILLLFIVTALVMLFRRPPVGLAMTWVLLILGPTSSFVPISTEVAAERRMYLPLAGLIALAVIGGWSLWGHLARRRGIAPDGVTRIALAALAVAASAAAWASFARGSTFGDPIGLWETAARVVPTNSRAYNNLGTALEQAGRVDEAVVAFERAIELRPSYDLADENRLVAQARSHYNLGRTLALEGRLDEAHAAYFKAIELAPGFSAPLNGLGLLMEGRGQVGQAKIYYRQAIAADPDLAFARLNLGRLLFTEGRYDEALEHLERAVALTPDRAEARATLAATLAAAGRPAEAVEHYRRATELSPDDGDLHHGLAHALSVSGDVAGSIEPFLAALRLQPDNVELLNNYGLALAAGGRIDEAIEQLERAVALEPNHAPSRNVLGSLLGGRGRHAEAIEHFAQALIVDPSQVQVAENLGRAYVATEQYRAAMQHLEASVDRWPDRPVLLESLARAYLGVGNRDAAAITIEKAIAAATAAGQTDRAASLRTLLVQVRGGPP